MRLKWILIAGSIAIVATPIVLLALGIRPKAIENRVLTPVPAITLEDLAGAEAYTEITDYVLDRFPGRDVAVELDATIDLKVFGESPSDAVVVGSEGWLYFAPSIDRECISSEQADDFARELQLAHSIVASTGRTLVFAIAPDKASIYPQHLGSASTRASCPKAIREAITASLDQQAPEAAVLAWGALAKRAEVDQIYHRHDTHWNSWGGSSFVEVLVDYIESGIAETSTVTRVGTGSYEGNLTLMLGVPWSEPSPQLETTRDGVGEPKVATIELKHDKTASRTTRAFNDAPMLEASTLLLHDSFGFALLPHLKPFFSDLTTVHETHIDYEYVRPLLANAETILLEKVEMWVPNFVLNERLGSKMASAFLEELGGAEAAVEQSPGSLVVAPPRHPVSGAIVYLVVDTDRALGTIHEVWTSATGPDEIRKLGGFRERVAWEMPAGAVDPIELFGFPEEVGITAYYVNVPLPPGVQAKTFSR